MERFAAIKIKTKLKKDELEKVLLGLDQTFGPMGSGGFGVRKSTQVEGLFEFTLQDCAPAHKYAAFLAKDGTIFASSLATYLMSALYEINIWFQAEPVAKRPEEIEKYYAQAR